MIKVSVIPRNSELKFRHVNLSNTSLTLEYQANFYEKIRLDLTGDRTWISWVAHEVENILQISNEKLQFLKLSKQSHL